MFIRTLIAASLILGGISVADTAEARHGVKRHYPGRAQVNHRIARQHYRITRELRQGDMTRPEARSLRRDLHSVRMQERAYARANDNHGHLTRGQVRDLNRQLNQTGQQIGH